MLLFDAVTCDCVQSVQTLTTEIDRHAMCLLLPCVLTNVTTKNKSTAKNENKKSMRLSNSFAYIYILGWTGLCTKESCKNSPLARNVCFLFPSLDSERFCCERWVSKKLSCIEFFFFKTKMFLEIFSVEWRALKILRFLLHTQLIHPTKNAINHPSISQFQSSLACWIMRKNSRKCFNYLSFHRFVLFE